MATLEEVNLCIDAISEAPLQDRARTVKILKNIFSKILDNPNEGKFIYIYICLFNHENTWCFRQIPQASHRQDRTKASCTR